MSELLERVRAEVRQRLEERRAAVLEYERLEAADAALAVLLASAAPTAAAADTPAAAAAAPRASRPARRSSAGPRTRAPRGANRAAVLKAAGDRPGASVGELAVASGIGRAVVYALVKTLAERGELVRRELPGGASGYALPAGSTEPGWTTAATAREADAPRSTGAPSRADPPAAEDGIAAPATTPDRPSGRRGLER
jgi:hypothetical protein